MALLVKSSETKKICVQNTSVEYPGGVIYARIEFGCFADGRTMEIHLTPYADHQGWKDKKAIPVDILRSTFANLQETETQSVETAHTHIASQLQSQGYNIEILL